MIIFMTFTTYLTVKILTTAGRKQGIAIYSKVVEFYLGKKLSVFFNINQMIYMIGLLISYQIVVFQMLGGFIYNLSDSFNNEKINSTEDFILYSFWGVDHWKIIIMCGLACLLLPLALLRDISKLRFSTVFGLFCFAIVTIVIICQLPFYMGEYTESTTIHSFDLSRSFDSHLYFFRAFGTLIFTMNCHIGIYPVYDKLYNNSERRVNKVILRSVVLDSVFFLLVGIAGYLTQPTLTPPIILNRLTIGHSDIIMTICRFLFIFFLAAKLAVVYNSLRIAIFSFFFKTTEISNKA